MSYDDTIEALMAQDVLRGRFPLLFYGNTVNGTADRYPTALFVWLLGPTALALRLAALALALVFVGSVAHTTRVVFGPRVAVLAGLLSAVPPYFLFRWGYEAVSSYVLTLTGGAWCLCLAWRILREGVWRTPGRRLLGLGLLAGVSWWTLYLSVVFLAPIGLALLAQGLRAGWSRRAPLLGRSLLALGGFGAGALPLLAFYAAHRLPLVPPGSLVDAARVRVHLATLTRQALPQILGVHPGVWGGALAAGYAATATLAAGGLLFSAGWWLARRRRGEDAGTVGLLLAVTAITLALPVVTSHGVVLRTARHLMPLYLTLPVFLAVPLDRIGRRLPLVEWAVVGAVLLGNLVGSLALTPALGAPAGAVQARAWADGVGAQIAFLRAHGLTRVYGGPALWAFFSDRRVWVSNSYAETVLEMSQVVDAADRIGWTFPARDPGFEATARAAGIGFRLVEGPGLVAYTDFSLPPTGYADVEPGGWSATASRSAETSALALDRHLDSAWRTRGVLEPGSFYQVDLGRPHRLGLLTWLPERFREIPAAFRVRVSPDGRSWREVAHVPRYFGPLYWSGTHPFQRIRRSRVEVRFPETEARLVRIELLAQHARHAWSIRELHVGTPVEECRGRPDVGALAAHLTARGVRFAYADHWLSAALVHASGGAIGALPSNGWVTLFGLMHNPEPDYVEPVRTEAGRAIVVDACPATLAEGVARVLWEGGVSHARETVAGAVVLRELRAPRYRGEPASWRALEPGTLEARLPAPRRVGHLLVTCPEPWEPPSADGVTAEISEDGERFDAAAARVVSRGKLRMSGPWLYRDTAAEVAVELAPGTARSVRLHRRGGAWCGTGSVRVGPAS